MKKIAIPLETTDFCSYGCGCVAKYKNGSGKLMCSSSSNSCPAIKAKNSLGVKNCGRDYVSDYNALPQETKDKMSWSRGLTKDTDPRVSRPNLIGKKFGVSLNGHTEETKRKISEARTKWLKDPENRKNWGRGKKSWMELCFEKWLLDNKIHGWVSEKHFWNPDLKKNYYVDFLFEENSLIVELDGNQHEKTIIQDSIRDEYLKTLGYTVVRISHKSFKERFFTDIGFFDILGR
jgi:very-short-patch-repair endonuclease